MMDGQGRKVTKESRALRGTPEMTGRTERKVRLVLKARLAPRARRVQPEVRGPPAPKVLRASKVCPA